MKTRMAGRTVTTLAVLALLAAACDSSSAPERPAPVASVAVMSPAQTLMVGEAMTLIATPKSADGEPLQRSVVWSSQDEQIATVSTTGVVTAVAPGLVNIVATSEGRSGATQLRIAVNPPAPVAEVRLSVDDEVRLEWNGSARLAAIAVDSLGAELPGRQVQWLTSRPDVASITETGFVEAVGPGVGMITARIEGVVANVGVRVKRAAVAAIHLDVPAGAVGLEVGETVFVGARLELVSGQIERGAVTWVSSDPSVATISDAGVLGGIEARSAGVATLTASAEGKSASTTVRISPVPTYDLIYNRWNAQLQSEIFTLSLTTPGAEPLRLNAGNVSRDPSPSPDGKQFVFAVSQPDAFGQQRQDDLYIVNRNGMNMRWLTRTPGMEDQPQWSPDGTKILFRGTDQQGTSPNLYVINVDGSGLTNLTATLPARVTDRLHPAWSPDGSRIAFVATTGLAVKVWTMNADGSNAAQLTTDAGFDATPTWSPSGDRIAFTRYDSAVPANGWDVMIVPVAGGAPVRLALPGDQLTPAWSPDGHYIAVTGTVVAGQGTQNIYTMRPDGSGLRLRTVNAAWGGGTLPAWIRR